MIQRIQSVFLFLAAVAIGLLFLIPMAQSTPLNGSVLFADTNYQVQDHSVLLGITAGALVLSVGAIFLFANRGRQRMVNIVTTVLLVGFIVAAYLIGRVDPSFTQATIAFGAFLPAIAILLLLVANYYIRKDDKLVRSMDRLR